MTEPKKSKELKEKENIYYSALVSAYVESSMERDRSLLYLCAGGIGLLVTLMTTVGVQSTFELLLYITSFLAFGVAIILILHVFKLNRKYLVQLASNEEADETELKKTDSIIYFLFISGVLLLFFIGLITSINQLITKEKNIMAKENKNDEKKTTRLIESVDDLAKMSPDTTVKKSLSDLAKLKPQADSSKDNKKEE